MDQPKCFPNKTKWVQWLAQAEVVATMDEGRVTKQTKCLDCTFDYQSQMIREGKCENPGHVFAPDE